MRLIDADAVLDWIKRQKESTDRARDVLITGETVLTVQSCLSEFERKVKKQPTAYDVEKVIEELENLREVELHTVDMCDELGNGDGESQYNDGVSQGRYEAFIEAIKIVERGGVDD